MTANPPSSRASRLVSLLAAWTCWLVGVHVAIVPCVVGFTLYALCSEEGWGNVLGSGAGITLAILAGTSLGSTATALLAGFAFYRGRVRRGSWQVAVAFVLALVSAVLFFTY